MINYSNYKIGEPLVSTGDILVREVTYKPKNEKRILKIYNTRQFQLKQFDRFAIMLDIFHNCKHPFMENIIDFSSKDEKGEQDIAIVIPYKQMKNLYEEIHINKNDIPTDMKALIIYSISCFLSSLHKAGGSLPLLDSHGIFFDDNHVLVTSSSLDPTDDVFGIYPWCSIEKMEKLSSQSSDIFALGAIAYEMEYKRYPLHDSRDKNEYMRLIKAGERPELDDTPVNRLIFQSMSDQPKSADEICKSLLNGEIYPKESLNLAMAASQSLNDSSISMDINFDKHFEKQLKNEDPLFTYLFASLYINDENKDAKAMKALESSAIRSFPAAQYLLSSFLENEDPKRSRELLAKSAHNGYVSALSKLGVVALQNKNVDEARQLFKASADMNDVLGMANYGQMTLIGAGCKPDEEEAMKYLLKAVSLGDSTSQFIVGSRFMEQGKNDEGMKLLLLSGAQGNMRAQTAVAFDLADPSSPHYNTRAALECLRDLIKAGSPSALVRAAQILMTGEGGVEKDEKEAVELYKKGAEKGVPNACIEYANCLINGIAVEKDRNKGLSILKLWAEHKYHPQAMYLYGVSILKENKDDKDALEFVKKAAHFQYTPAIMYLASIAETKEERLEYLKNAANNHDADGMRIYALEIKEKEREKAISLLKESKKLGDKLAAVSLATLLIESDKQEEVNEGTEMLKELAANDVKEAIFAMGMMMMEGNKLEKNLTDGAKLVIESARLGLKQGIVEAVKILREGLGVDKDEGLANELEKKL
ncbi:hypothetical protein TVAG_114390 [Trichomonas vaginalis G3]|uniref:Protein kinase domain-containing protein n=1 Tax=Trichomonas vaginalis (strain ATCC PRA-98 / G3) TaxID=412133 RepID=A2FAQ8_TRIV3|nr:tetratricopeptide repeat domain domain-containing protein [Trichomonas vaginalis G3]EAX97987.1 hypothetical protein TVAG_114390 [Trichomonas vaginalis G3]KAI5521905.1 tetratricopeptide repeat domain domain-containing protein [Trichomonas vaginalis G3]|eukprot:XP_001310917.1 hypothetical protein [Trichomonas vaginalis G3]